MKRWIVFILALAVVILPCLPVGAVDELKEDFESYQTVDKLKGAGWAFSPDVTGGKISLETVESMDGDQTKAVRVAAKLDAGVSGNPDVYIQKDSIDMTGETVTAFRIKMNETWSFRKIIWREGTSGGTSFITPFAVASQKIKIFDKEVNDKNGEPLKLKENIWYDIVIVSTQTVGSNEIPYQFYMNGYCYADDTYTADNKPRKYVASIRFSNQLNREDVRDISTDYDDIYVGKRTNWSFGNMIMTPANGNMAVPAEGGIIKVDFGIRMDTETIKKEQVVLSKYFEGETTTLEDFSFQSNPYGFTIQLPEGAFEKEAKYTLQLSELYDFAGNLIPDETRELFFETAGEPYIPEFQVDSLVGADFTGFKGTALSTEMTVNSNAGTITGENLDEEHGDSAALTLMGPDTTSGPWLGLNVPAANIPSSGTVVFQCDVRMTVCDATLQLFTIKDSAGKWNTDLNFFQDGSISIVDGNKKVVKKLMDYDTTTWYTIREEINLDTKKISVYINEQLIVEDFALQNSALVDVPSARITLVVPNNKEATAYIDNFSIGIKKEVPGIMKMKFLDSTGILRGGQAPQDMVAMQLFFSMPMDRSTITEEHFKLLRSADELPVECNVDYDGDTNIVSVRPEQPLVMNMDYKLEIAKEVRAESAVALKEKKVWKFESAAGDFGRVHLAVLNEENEEISSITNLSAGDSVRGQAELKNMVETSQEAVVVFAWYQGDILKAVKMMPVMLGAYSSETFTTDAITMESAKESTLRVFVWGGESGRQAVCEPLTVQ